MDRILRQPIRLAIAKGGKKRSFHATLSVIRRACGSKKSGLLRLDFALVLAPAGDLLGADR